MGGGYKSLGGMDPDTFAPSDVIHLFVMEIDLDLSVGDLGGAAAPDDDEVGEFSNEELVDLPEGDDDDEPIVIDNVNDAIAQLAALEDTGGIAEGAANANDADGPPDQPADDPVAQCAHTMLPKVLPLTIPEISQMTLLLNLWRMLLKVLPLTVLEIS